MVVLTSFSPPAYTLVQAIREVFSRNSEEALGLICDVLHNLSDATEREIAVRLVRAAEGMDAAFASPILTLSKLPAVAEVLVAEQPLYDSRRSPPVGGYRTPPQEVDEEEDEELLDFNPKSTLSTEPARLPFRRRVSSGSSSSGDPEHSDSDAERLVQAALSSPVSRARAASRLSDQSEEEDSLGSSPRRRTRKVAEPTAPATSLSKADQLRSPKSPAKAVHLPLSLSLPGTHADFGSRIVFGHAAPSPRSKAATAREGLPGQDESRPALSPKSPATNRALPGPVGTSDASRQGIELSAGEVRASADSPIETHSAATEPLTALQGASRAKESDTGAQTGVRDYLEACPPVDAVPSSTPGPESSRAPDLTPNEGTGEDVSNALLPPASPAMENDDMDLLGDEVHLNALPVEVDVGVPSTPALGSGHALFLAMDEDRSNPSVTPAPSVADGRAADVPAPRSGSTGLVVPETDEDTTVLPGPDDAGPGCMATPRVSSTLPKPTESEPVGDDPTADTVPSGHDTEHTSGTLVEAPLALVQDQESSEHPADSAPPARTKSTKRAQHQADADVDWEPSGLGSKRRRRAPLRSGARKLAAKASDELLEDSDKAEDDIEGDELDSLHDDDAPIQSGDESPSSTRTGRTTASSSRRNGQGVDSGKATTETESAPKSHPATSLSEEFKEAASMLLEICSKGPADPSRIADEALLLLLPLEHLSEMADEDPTAKPSDSEWAQSAKNVERSHRFTTSRWLQELIDICAFAQSHRKMTATIGGEKSIASYVRDSLSCFPAADADSADSADPGRAPGPPVVSVPMNPGVHSTVGNKLQGIASILGSFAFLPFLLLSPRFSSLNKIRRIASPTLATLSFLLRGGRPDVSRLSAEDRRLAHAAVFAANVVIPYALRWFLATSARTYDSHAPSQSQVSVQPSERRCMSIHISAVSDEAAASEPYLPQPVIQREDRDGNPLSPLLFGLMSGYGSRRHPVTLPPLSFLTPNYTKSIRDREPVRSGRVRKVRVELEHVFKRTIKGADEAYPAHPTRPTVDNTLTHQHALALSQAYRASFGIPESHLDFMAMLDALKDESPLVGGASHVEVPALSQQFLRQRQAFFRQHPHPLIALPATLPTATIVPMMSDDDADEPAGLPLVMTQPRRP